jgi:ribosomal-protein-alanine N-acetyltransferase
MAIVETARLILRDFAMSDWEALNAIVSDPDVTRYMHFAHWDEEKRRQWLLRMVQEASRPHPWHDNWALTLRSSGQLIGWLFIGASREAAEQGTRGCGYAVAPRCWGQGFMTEALRAAFTYELRALGVQRLVADCEVANAASARVLQKSGMTSIGTFYDADFEGSWAERQHFMISAPTTKAD